MAGVAGRSDGARAGSAQAGDQRWQQGRGRRARGDVAGIAHQRCLVHKLRNLVACVPRSLRAAVVRDFQTITHAMSPAVVHAALAVVRRTWATTWSAVVVSLEEAGAGRTAFTAFPPAQ